MESLTIRAELECVICYEISASPIQNCANGHVVCGVCFEKVKKCPQCKEELAVCPLAERIARRHEFMLICPNSTQGCGKTIKSTEMLQHIKTSCGYRPIACMYKGMNTCAENAMKMKDVFHHLTTLHKVSNVCNILGSIGYTNLFRVLDVGLVGQSERIVGTQFDGKEFLAFKRLEGGCIFDWIAVIGDEDVAEKYKVIIRSPLTVPTLKYRWELPVVPLHESKFSKVKERGELASMHWTSLAPFCKEKEFSPTKTVYKYSWIDDFEIVKV